MFITPSQKLASYTIDSSVGGTVQIKASGYLVSIKLADSDENHVEVFLGRDAARELACRFKLLALIENKSVGTLVLHGRDPETYKNRPNSEVALRPAGRLKRPFSTASLRIKSETAGVVKTVRLTRIPADHFYQISEVLLECADTAQSNEIPVPNTYSIGEIEYTERNK